MKRFTVMAITPRQYGVDKPQLGLETIATHMVHWSTLETKSQFCTALLTFVSAVYQGNAKDAILRHVTEFAEMQDPSAPLEVQAGTGRDIARETLELAALKPKVPGLLFTGEGLQVQASWDEVRTNYGFGVDCFKSVRHAPFYKHARKIVASCLAGSLFSEEMHKNHHWFHKRLFEGVDHTRGPDPLDLFDELLDLTRAVVDAATYCIQQGSVAPLLGRGMLSYEMDREYAFVEAHVPHYLNGNLSRVTALAAGEDPTGKAIMVTPEAFVVRVSRLKTQIERAHKGTIGAEKAMLTKRLSMAMKWSTEIAELLSRQQLRPAPWVVGLRGPTAQGKTAAGMHMMKHLLQCNGFPHTQDVITQIVASSNFMDTVTNSTMGVYFDDFRNTKPAHVKCDELMMFIRLCNNSNVNVEKAAIDDKGTTFHQSKVVILSTNTKDLFARETQVEPSAVMRRVNMWVDVSVAPEFAKEYTRDDIANRPGQLLPMIDPSKVKNVGDPVQRYTVFTCLPRARTEASPGDQYDEYIVRHNGKDLKDIPYDELMRYAAEQSQRHFENQARMLQGFLSDQLDDICPHGGVTAPFCSLCKAAAAAADALQVQAGERHFDFINTFPTEDEFVPPSVSTAAPETPLSESPSGGSMASAPASFPVGPSWRERLRVVWEGATIAAPPPDVPLVFGWLSALTKGRFDIEDYAITHFDGVMLALLAVAPATATAACGILSLVGFGPLFVWFTWAGMWSFLTLTMSRNARGWVSARVAGATYQQLKDASVRMAKSSFLVVGSVLAVLVMIQGLKRLVMPAKEKAVESGLDRHVYVTDPFEYQGGCASAPPSQGSVPDPAPKVNTWERGDPVLHHRVVGPTRNMTADQIMSKAEGQLYVMDIHYKSAVVSSNAFVVATNYMVCPAHNFVGTDGAYSQIQFIELHTTTASFGPYFRIKLSVKQLYRLPGDAMLVQINAGGTMPTVIDLITEDMPDVSFPAVELYRNTQTCELERRRYLVTPGTFVCDSHRWRYRGGEYVRPEPTFKGLCGALVLSATRYPQVVGFHVMGAREKGVVGFITRNEIAIGIEELRRVGPNPFPIITQDDTTPFTADGNEAAAEIGPLHTRSVMRELKEATAIKVLGSLVNYTQVRPKTRLGISPISSIVEEECGEVRAHEPPSTLGKATVEVAKLHEMADRSPLNPEDSELAHQDQYDELRATVISLEFGPYLKPLTRNEATCGVAGTSTVRGINRSTAAGWPYTGDKRRFVLDEALDGLPDGFVLTPEMHAEVDKAWALMAQLKRPNFVFKGCQKDEAVKLGKLKTRVFEGCPMAFTVIMRMLYMPYVRLMLLARDQTSSSVGIDATSSDWDRLFRHISAYNGECCIQGDHPHFDTSQMYMEMMSQFIMIIGIYREFGTFSEEELNVAMVGAEETCRHYTLLRGDVAITEGIQASGGVLTVYNNNPIGAARFISGFYGMARKQGDIPAVPLWDHRDDEVSSGGIPIRRNGREGLQPLLPNLKGRFRDYVRDTYYGDDFLQAARKEILKWYNQQTLYDYFAAEGLGLTDANKGPFATPTTPWDEASFLKRGFRHDEEVGAHLAPLEMKSIYKSLHVWPQKLDTSPQAHAAQLFDGAFRELFQHGRAEFEARVPKLLVAAERFGCREYLRIKDPTFEDMTVRWHGREMEGALAGAGCTE